MGARVRKCARDAIRVRVRARVYTRICVRAPARVREDGMTEKQIETRLVKRLKEAVPDALCLKFTCPGNDGVPDRIILAKNGMTVFVELKAPGKKPRALQYRWAQRLQALGFAVYMPVDSYEGVENVVEFIRMGGDA